jgi:hypothetical protein
MTVNLDTLKSEILSRLAGEGFVVFHGYSRLADSDSFVAWDLERQPDYRMFLEAAKQAGVKLVVYNERVFSAPMLEDTAERLEAANLTGEERRSLERRLREFRPYEGFTAGVELSFDYQGRVYLFRLSAEWYEDYLDLADEIEAASEAEAEEGDSMSGYYSSN